MTLALAAMLACGALAWPAVGTLRVALLVVAQALGLLAGGAILGRLPAPGWRWLHDLVLQAGVLAGFTLWTGLLTIWPLTSLVRQPSLAGSLLLSLGLCLAAVPLWPWWPWFGWPLAGSDAAGLAAASGAQQRIQIRAVSARTVGQPGRFVLPVAGSQLLIVCAILALGGWVQPPAVAVWLALLVLLALPLGGLLVAWRCRVAAGLAAAMPVAAAPETPETPAAPARSLRLSEEDALPGRREEGLIEAARQGDIERALALLAADADPEARPSSVDGDQRSLLALATLLPDTRVLRALIAYGARVNGDGKGLAPLVIAVRDGHRNRDNAVMMLLANGANPDVVDGEGNAPLHFAALVNAPEVAAMLLDAGATVDACNGAGHTALATACQAGNVDMVGFLLERGARTEVGRAVPALVAAAGGTSDVPEVVRRLLARRANVDARDVLGRSALMHAALAGHVASVEALLEARADVDAVDQRGTSALMEAARAGSNDVLRALAARHPDVAREDTHGRDALLLACQSARADADTVRILLALGADPHRPGAERRNAIDHAAAAGRWHLVAVLDPDTPLPASLCDDLRPEPGADDPAHLLDALRFGHWAAVSGFRTLIHEWPMPARADLYVELLAEEHAAARRWLLRHGLDAAACDSAGRSLPVAAIDALPASASALHELLEQGQRLAGRGLLARALARLEGVGGGEALAAHWLDHDGDPFGPGPDGKTSLHLAIAQGLPGLARRLLESGVDPDARDERGQTPLHYVLRQTTAATEPLLRLLIAHGADPEAPDGAGESPLGQALERGCAPAIRWLRWNRWPLPGRALRESDLPLAAAAGASGAVTRLLELGFDPNARDAHGASALLRACGGGHREVARVLLDAGGDPTLATPAGATALTAAVTGRHGALVDLLVTHGVALDGRLRGGATALLVSAALGHADVARRLLEAGADIAACDERGRGVLHAAAQFCFGTDDSLAARRLLDVLLEHGADATRRDDDGASPLLFMLGGHAAPGAPCNATHLGALVPALLQADVSVNAADGRGVTALHACAMHALLGPVKLLIAHGADRRARDEQDRTAADIADILGYADVALELRPA